MKITIGSDHKGFELKSKIIKHFSNISWNDVGTSSDQRTDYPVFAKKVCSDILSQNADLGILVCGSGVGMSIAANRFKKIYAALCWNKDVARFARQDDNANVLILPSEFVDDDLAFLIIESWLNSEFKGNEYAKRLELIDE